MTCKCCKRRGLVALATTSLNNNQVLVCPYCDGDDWTLASKNAGASS